MREHTDCVKHTEIIVGNKTVFCMARFVGWCEVSEGFTEGEEQMVEFEALEAFDYETGDKTELTEELEKQAEEVAESAEWS